MSLRDGPFDGPGRPIFRVRVAEAIVAFEGALNLNLNVAGCAQGEDFGEYYYIVLVDAVNSAQHWHVAARSNFNCA